jgi:hypothetical protein
MNAAQNKRDLHAALGVKPGDNTDYVVAEDDPRCGEVMYDLLCHITEHDANVTRLRRAKGPKRDELIRKIEQGAKAVSAAQEHARTVLAKVSAELLGVK